MNYFDILLAKKVGGSSGGGGGSSVTVKSLNVSENGTYTAPKGTAYTPVRVNVPTPQPQPDSSYAFTPIISMTGASSLYFYSTAKVIFTEQNEYRLVAQELQILSNGYTRDDTMLTFGVPVSFAIQTPLSNRTLNISVSNTSTGDSYDSSTYYTMARYSKDSFTVVFNPIYLPKELNAITINVSYN